MERRIPHNCKECESSLQNVLDGACSTNERTNFLNQLDLCPTCKEKFQREKAFKAFLQAKVPKRQVSSNIRDHIRDSLRDQF